MPHPLLFFVGYRRLRVGVGYAGELMNLCLKGGYVYRNFSFCGEYACFVCSLRTSRALLEACRDRGIAVVVEKECGLPFLLYRYRRRVGLPIGALLFALILFSSGRVVWGIRVEGNQTLNESEVLEQLAQCGLRVGAPLRELNTGVIENRVLILSDEISWISINLLGTEVEVEIREFVPAPEEEDYAAANLVASRDGVIEGFQDVRGNLAVSIGDAVSEGELLVGGLYDIEGGGVRYTCAEGQVLARTQRDFLVEIPLQYQKKVYTGRVKTEKYWIFFEKEIKFFGNTGNSPDSCDTINTVEYFTVGENTRLPFGVRTVRYVEYELCDARRTPDQAMELAFFALRCRMEEACPDGALVRKTPIGELTEHAYVLRCTAQHIENIAITKEIEIEGIS